MRVVAIVQARMGSARFPGKSLKALHGRPMITHVLQRVRAAGFDDVWLATTDDERDDLLASTARDAGVNVFRGDTYDVLQRLRNAAELAKADTVVRVTGDCPLWAPDVGRRVVERHLARLERKHHCGIITSNDTRISGFPDGLDTEVFQASVLEDACARARLAPDREHVTRWMYTNAIHDVLIAPDDLRRVKLSVDVPVDLDFVSTVLANVKSGALEWAHTREAVTKVVYSGRKR